MGPEPASWVFRIWLPPKPAAAATAMAASVAVTGVAHVDFVERVGVVVALESPYQLLRPQQVMSCQGFEDAVAGASSMAVWMRPK